MLINATEGIDPKLIKKEEDIISYCLFPEVALEYCKWRALPPEQRPPIPADVELNKEKAPAQAAPAPVSQPKPFLAQEDYQALNQLLTKIGEMNLNEFTIRRDDLSVSLKGNAVSASTQAGAAPAKAIPVAAAAAKPVAPAPVPKAETKTDAAPGLTINAPLNGTFYLTPGPGKPAFCKEGDEVKAGETVCIVEAMKLLNAIKAPCNCRIIKPLLEHGKPVKKDDPLIAYEKLG
jgi:acetyl-CoA carboxylase biotin carboxyl carrier protein